MTTPTAATHTLDACLLGLRTALEVSHHEQAQSIEHTLSSVHLLHTMLECSPLLATAAIASRLKTCTALLVKALQLVPDGSSPGITMHACAALALLAQLHLSPALKGAHPCAAAVAELAGAVQPVLQALRALAPPPPTPAASAAHLRAAAAAVRAAVHCLSILAAFGGQHSALCKAALSARCRAAPAEAAWDVLSLEDLKGTHSRFVAEGAPAALDGALQLAVKAYAQPVPCEAEQSRRREAITALWERLVQEQEQRRAAVLAADSTDHMQATPTALPEATLAQLSLALEEQDALHRLPLLAAEVFQCQLFLARSLDRAALSALLTANSLQGAMSAMAAVGSTTPLSASALGRGARLVAYALAVGEEEGDERTANAAAAAAGWGEAIKTALTHLPALRQ